MTTGARRLAVAPVSLTATSARQSTSSPMQRLSVRSEQPAVFGRELQVVAAIDREYGQSDKAEPGVADALQIHKRILVG